MIAIGRTRAFVADHEPTALLLDAQGNPVGQAQPLIRFRAYQEAAFWRMNDVRRMLMLWRRQSGKTYTMAAYCLFLMMQKPWALVTFVSASLLVGKELIVKEAQIWRGALDTWRKQAKDAGGMLETSVDDDYGALLDMEAFLDVFTHNRLEAKLYHSKTSFSRTQIIAPNPDTARGYTGTIMLDEIGFIPDFQDMMEAMSPIASSDPTFRCLMATTPPKDDAHYSFELAVPPAGVQLPAFAKGNFYKSEAGILVHRCDVHDAELAGVHLYDEDDAAGVALTPAEHRSRALDRDAWDRNYGLIFLRGGTSAVTLADLHRAMSIGAGQCVFSQDALPQSSDWLPLLGTGAITLGLDIATTEGGRSNPSSLTVAQRMGALFMLRMTVIWKTADPDVTRAMLRETINAILSVGLRPGSLDIDATSEKYFAAQIRREFGGILPVNLVVSSEKTTFMGEDMLWKIFLGNCTLNLMQDGKLGMPGARYMTDDWRLVKRTPYGFTTEVASDGKHGDTFDSAKLALHRLFNPRGPVFAEAVTVGDFGTRPQQTGWLNPYASQFEQRPGHSF